LVFTFKLGNHARIVKNAGFRTYGLRKFDSRPGPNLAVKPPGPASVRVKCGIPMPTQRSGTAARILDKNLADLFMSGISRQCNP
jgi:hypothetical protein